MLTENLEVATKILRKYTDFIISQDPLIGDIPSGKTIHSRGTIYRSEEKRLEIPLAIMSAQVSFTVTDVRDFNLEKICCDIYEFSQSFLEDMAKTLFATITQISDFTGNVVDGKGKKLSHEMMLEMLEKIHIDFDEEGNPKFPSLVIHPDMAKSLEKLKSEEPLYKEKYEEIISRKREAYYAEKGSRRLSRID
jgi:hypothetical protein